ncbi:MAG TPA: Calx-beta domain-containing protein [Anaerolineales bacterium]|nr:Calx-beta domain-containing protein [Anaerolineales bacterium]
MRITHKKERAQGLVEFALVLPLLLLVMFAVIEFGRLLFIYSVVFTSSREAARYGSAAGDVGNYLPHYRHCDGMRSAARRVGTMAGVADGNIAINYDDGDPAHAFGNCPSGGLGPAAVNLGHRVVVRVSAMYQPLLPLVRLPAFPITSTSARTILKDISIQGTPPAPTGSVSVFFNPAEQSAEEGDPGEAGTPRVVTLQVRLSAPTASDVTVHFGVDAGSSTAAGDDFTLDTASPVVILAGDISANLAVTIQPDLTDEDDESVLVRIVDVNNGNIGSPDTHLLTIVDDDEPPTVDFVPETQDLQEDDGSVGVSSFVRMQLSNPSGRTITVPFSADVISSTATIGQDFVLNTTSPVTFAPGDTSELVLFTTSYDAMDEEDESMILVMGEPVNAVKGSASVHTTWIIDNDEPPEVFFTWEASEAPESAGVVDIEVRLSAPSGLLVEVPYTLGGDAFQGVDYTVPLVPLQIPAGQSTANIRVTLLDDGDDDDQDETVVLILGTPTNARSGVPGEHTLTITATPTPPTVSFTQSSQSESESVGTLSVGAQLSRAYYQNVVVPLSLSGTAANGADYTVSVGQILIPAGSANASVSVIIVNDALDENDETVVLTMGTPTNATLGSPSVHTLTILDDEALPLVYFTSPSQSGMEDVGQMLITVRLSPVSGRDVTVPFSLGGSASLGADYNITPASTVVIPAGNTEATIAIQVIYDDVLGEGNETVEVTIGTPVNATRGSNYDHHTATITAWICPSATSDPYFGTGNDNKKLIWELQNSDPNTTNLLEVTVFWPTGNGAILEGIVFGSDPIGNSFYYPASLGYLDVVNPNPLWSGVFSTRQMTFLFDKRPNISAGQEIVVSARFANCLPFSKRIGN